MKMANELDEQRDAGLKEGRKIEVINKTLPVTIGIESTLFTVLIWLIPIVIGMVVVLLMINNNDLLAVILGIVIAFMPGILFSIAKVNAANYLLQLQQKLQHDASQIDNYLEQRVIILKNAAKLLEKGMHLDQDTFTKIAELRSGNIKSDIERNDAAQNIDKIAHDINVAFENYPDLKAHHEIEDVMQQNSYLQREITAAREVYNDTVLTWNKEIYEWPVKKIVAAKKGYTTRIPFATSDEIKHQASEVFF